MRVQGTGRAFKGHCPQVGRGSSGALGNTEAGVVGLGEAVRVN